MKLHSRGKGVTRYVSLSLWGPRTMSLLFLFLALALLLFSVARPDRLQVLRTDTADIFAPVLFAVNAPLQQAASYVRTVTGLAEMQTENARLQAENVRLRAWYQTAMVLKTENESLQQLLNIDLPPFHRYVTARVISDSGNAYVKSLLVLAGRRRGVGKGQAVLAGDGLIGRVVETGDKTARILLLTDINSRIPVLVEGGNDRAILAGNNAALPVLVHLPPDRDVREGARVLTSGHGGLFPFGLPVGDVVKTENGELAVRLYADISRLTYVRIVEKNDNPGLHIKE